MAALLSDVDKVERKRAQRRAQKVRYREKHRDNILAEKARYREKHRAVINAKKAAHRTKIKSGAYAPVPAGPRAIPHQKSKQSEPVLTLQARPITQPKHVNYAKLAGIASNASTNLGRCQGTCQFLEARKGMASKQQRSQYKMGAKRCEICKVFMWHGGHFCPCCGTRLMIGKKGKYAARIHKEIDIDAQAVGKKRGRTK